MKKRKKRVRQDYLRIIHQLYEDKGVKSIKLAKEMNISKASVSEMLRKLEKEKLVKIKPYSKIKLTSKGKKKAEELSHQYFLIKKFLEKVFNHGHKKARKEACELEHSLSKESVKTISQILNQEKPVLKPTYIG